MNDHAIARQNALAFLKRNKTAVLATVGEHGPHASAIHYTADDDFNVYFLTLMNSRKYTALAANPRVAFTVLREDVPQTLQIEGTAVDVSLDESTRGKKDELFNVLNANPFFYAPITKLDPATSAVIWVRPEWIRWADYAFAKEGNERVWNEITVKSV